MKFCIDCKHCISCGPEYFCYRKKLVSPVHGETVDFRSCIFERTSYFGDRWFRPDVCGVEGKHFEPSKFYKEQK